MLVNLIICVVILFITYLWYKNRHFHNSHINYLKPLPIFGNVFQVVFGKKHIVDLTKDIYDNFPQDKYVGLFNFLTPMLLIKDVDLLRKIYIKDFEHFINHMPFSDEDCDPLFAKNLFSLTGERWKEMRSTLSPAFTSSKMRGMFPLMLDCTDNLINHIHMSIEDSNNKNKAENFAEFDTKELATYFANDVIATCAFGVKIDSLSDKKNDFYKFSKVFTDFSAASSFKLFLFFLSPMLVKALNIEISDKSATTFFRKLVLNNMKIREEKSITRLDMIHLLMLAKKGSLSAENKSTTDDSGFATVTEELKDSKLKKTQWTDDDIVAQALVFIFAGFDTVSTVLSFVLHEIAMNPDVQEKLYDEIHLNVDVKLKTFDYVVLNKLKYLDMVVSETLRLWPPVPILDRTCSKPYTLPPQNESSQHGYKLESGDGIWISAYDIQRNPKYYPSPEKFDPERFSDENKINIDPITFMPFGLGPRACIGSRFALMEIKMFIVYILSHFEIIPTPNTPNPINLKPHFFNMMPEGNFWVGLKSRGINK